MRFGFVTCVQLGLDCMEEIDAQGGHLDLVVTLHDELARQKSGRVYLDTFSQRHGAELIKIRNINDPEAIEAIRNADLDWLFIIGWSQIAREAILRAPGSGILGIHPTLLPVGRGRASIPWAILKGLSETGVTLFKLDLGVDTGPIIAQERIAVSVDETATSLYTRIADAHRTLIRSAWPVLAGGGVELRWQDESLATEWPGRTPEDGRITIDMTTDEVDRLVRATTHPYPGAFGDLDGRRLRIWSGIPGAAEGARIDVADGSFTAIDFEWEQMPQSGGG